MEFLLFSIVFPSLKWKNKPNSIVFNLLYWRVIQAHEITIFLSNLLVMFTISHHKERFDKTTDFGEKFLYLS